MKTAMLCLVVLGCLMAGCSDYPATPREVGLAFVSSLEAEDFSTASRYLFVEDGRFAWQVTQADPHGEWLRERWRMMPEEMKASYLEKFRALLNDEPIVPVPDATREAIVKEQRYPPTLRSAAENDPARLVMNPYVLWIKLQDGRWKIAEFDDVEHYRSKE